MNVLTLSDQPPTASGRFWRLAVRVAVLHVNELALRDGIPPLRPVAEFGEAVILQGMAGDLIFLPTTPKTPSA